MGSKKSIDEPEKRLKRRKSEQECCSSDDSDSDSSLISLDEETKKKLLKKLLQIKKKENKKKKKKKKNKVSERKHKKQEKFPDKKEEVRNEKGNEPEGSRNFVPMTKEQWEKQQNTLRRVYDEETGRMRLIRGTNEIVEECVSRERQLLINKQATAKDGEYFQKVLAMKRK